MIKVILKAAFTVILAAVIGTFVLGLGNQVKQTAPNAKFEFDLRDNHPTDSELEITHNDGDGISASELVLLGDVAESGQNWNEAGSNYYGSPDTVRAGDSVVVNLSSDRYSYPRNGVRVV